MTLNRRKLPQEFLDDLAKLEQAYLAEEDPIRQSGFSGGPTRWKEERSPILEAIEKDGEIIDIGCANGYLLECLAGWAREKGVKLDPYGLDQGASLIEIVKERFPSQASQFYVGNAWDWKPPRRFRYAYALYDCVPEDFLAEFVQHLLGSFVAPSGRLIMGAYGSRSDRAAPFDIAGFLTEHGFVVSGTAYGGEAPISAFAWIERSDDSQSQ